MTLAAPISQIPAFAPRPTALRISQLRVAYPGCPPVLDGVDLQLYAGERVGLLGPNGAGKTTLFLTICGVLAATSGQVHLFERLVKPKQFRAEVGLVFQNAADQLFSLSVQEDVAFGPINMGLPDDVVAARVAAALALTGTTHLAERAPHHLSGGERRMVAIASVLAMHPQLVIYDEPSANLDLRARRRLIQFLQGQSPQAQQFEGCPHSETLSQALPGTQALPGIQTLPETNASRETLPHQILPQTQLVSSHDLELILEVCDRVILLDQGQILADGAPQNIMANAELMEAHGLEVPSPLR